MNNTDRIAEIRARAEAARNYITIKTGRQPLGNGLIFDCEYLLEQLAQSESERDELLKQVVELAQESVRRDVALAKLEAEVERLDVEVDVWMQLQAKTESDNRWLREAQRWVPVSERLPDTADTVEAWSPVFGAFDAYFKNKQWYTRGHEIRVTHWRISAPPEKGETP